MAERICIWRMQSVKIAAARQQSRVFPSGCQPNEFWLLDFIYLFLFLAKSARSSHGI